MDFTYHFHQTYLKENKYNEFDSKGSSPQNPSLIFLYEILIAYLRELSVYLLKLKGLGITNEKVKEDFLNSISSMVINIEYTTENFIEIIARLYDDMIQAKEVYISVCERNNLKTEIFRSILKDPRKLSLSDLIRQGQELFMLKYNSLNPDQMSLFEFLLNLVKSICIYLIQLRELGVDDEKAFEGLYFLAGMKNSPKVFAKEAKKAIKDLLEINKRLLQKLYEVQIERYGEIESTEICLSTKSNKAILISGSNLKELELLLEATKGKGIDIYTHGNMLLAHAYPKFKTYSHLVGHFGEELENYLLDFSKFPGVIFLTKHSFLKVENLYQCRIYTADVIAPQGIGIVKNNNFEKLIETALRAEGFTKIIEKPTLKLTLSEKEILDKVTEITQKIEEGEIKCFFAMQEPNAKRQENYFNNFLNLLGSDCFVLSFSYFNPNASISHIESDYEIFLLYKALEILRRKISIEELNLIILFTSCGINILAHAVYIKQIGIKKVYFADCPPNLFSPTLIDSIRRIFDIKFYTNPEDDLKEMLK